MLSPKGTLVESMFIVLSGWVAIFVDRGAGRHKVMEWRGGDVTGLLPYSRLSGPPGDSVALPKCRINAGASTSCTSVDLPDPLTPVMHTSRLSGISTSMFFRLCSAAPRTSMLAAEAAGGVVEVPATRARPAR